MYSMKNTLLISHPGLSTVKLIENVLDLCEYCVLPEVSCSP